MKQQNYIDERMKEFAMNIDEFSVGETVIDSDGALCKITNKTINSIEVYIIRKKREGINHKQWFDMHRFNYRFKKQ